MPAPPKNILSLTSASPLTSVSLYLQTHNLSYVYGRATRAVSIATPAYLADRLCDRGRCYLYDAYNGHSSLMEGGDWVRDVHGNLNNTMFYI